jgi:hypothetical protein
MASLFPDLTARKQREHHHAWADQMRSQTSILYSSVQPQSKAKNKQVSFHPIKFLNPLSFTCTFFFFFPPLATPLTTFVLLYSSSCFPTLFSSPPWLWHGNVAVGAVVRRCVGGGGFTLRTSALGHGHGCEIGTQPRTSFSSGTVDETTNGRLRQGYSRIEDKGPLPSVSLCRRPSFIRPRSTHPSILLIHHGVLASQFAPSPPG